jgi:hypothetical protein
LLKTVKHAAIHVGVFGLGVVGTLGVAVAANPSALAAEEPVEIADVPACVANGDYGQVGAAEDPSNTTSDDIRGTRASVRIGNGPTPCQRISSIYVQSPTGGGLFEFGWVIGYSNCSNQTYSHPHLFYWSIQRSTGASQCRVWTSPTPTEAQYDTLQVSDTNANSYWGSYFNGGNLQPNGINMDFARGWSTVAMERGGTNDDGYARWNELSEYHDGNGWSYWDNGTQVVDNDPAYHLEMLNVHSARSQPN